MNELTSKQRLVLDYISDCWWEGYTATSRELMIHFGWSSPNATMCHVRALRDKGYLCENDCKAGFVMTPSYLHEVKTRKFSEFKKRQSAR